MAAVGRFSFFNIGVSSSDIVTDFLTFSYLVDDNPRWASLTLFWTIMPYLVRTVFFFHGKWTGRLKQCDTWWEVIVQYYKEAGSHLPVNSAQHMASQETLRPEVWHEQVQNERLCRS